MKPSHQVLRRQVVRAASSQMQTTGSRIAKASASLRVTGVLEWVRMSQNEETNAFYAKKLDIVILASSRVFERSVSDFHNRRIACGRRMA